LSVERG